MQVLSKNIYKFNRKKPRKKFAICLQNVGEKGII